MPGDIDIGFVGGIRLKVRFRQKSKPCHRVEGCFDFIPIETRIFDPEVGVVKLAPISHLAGVEKLESKFEGAGFAVFIEVPDQLVLQAIRISCLQGMCSIVRGWGDALLHNLDRSVTKRHSAPITELLIRFDGLVRLYLC